MVYKAEELMEATDNLNDKSHLIGKGGFGKVYRGILRTAHVAVKVLSEVILLRLFGGFGLILFFL